MIVVIGNFQRVFYTELMRKAWCVVGVLLSLFSAGFVVGLGFVAAAVKFTAPRPELLDLLDVGRVQFGALHQAEWVLIPAACVALLLGNSRLWVAVVPTLALFLYQALVVTPPLHARMVARLAGEPVAGSGLHEVYVYVAVGLVGLLTTQGVLAMVWVPRPQEEFSASASPSLKTHAGTQ